MNIAVALEDFIKTNCDKVSQTGQSYVFDCPVCFSKKKLYLRKKDGVFICFKCSQNNKFSGKAEIALSKITNIPIDQVVSFIYGKNIDGTLVLDSNILEDDEFITEDDIIIRDWPETAYELDDKRSARGLKYLESRGIPLNIAKQYGIKFDIKSKRVCFPVNSDNFLVGWQGRTIFQNVQPKAMTSAGFKKSKFLMFYGANPSSEHIILCEGPIDALKAHRLKGNVATMGKIVSKDQIDILKKSKVKTIYLGLDNDAYNETENLVRELHGKFELKQIKPLNNKKDLGEMSFDEIDEAFLKAENVTANTLFVFL